MEFCFTDSTRIAAADDSTRGVYPAPDLYPYPPTTSTFSTSTTPAMDTDSGTPEVSIVTGVPAADSIALTVSASDERDTDEADEAATTEAEAAVEIEPTVAAAPASTLAVIEPNTDIAEALQHLLQTLPGVASVATLSTSDELLRSLASAAEVSGFAAPAQAFTAADVTVPEIIFLDTGKACDTSARDARHLRDSIEELRRTLPSTALVLMSVYPDRLQSDLRGMVTACIRKDTSRSELADLIARVRTARAGHPAHTDVAGT